MMIPLPGEMTLRDLFQDSVTQAPVRNTTTKAPRDNRKARHRRKTAKESRRRNRSA